MQEMFQIPFGRFTSENRSSIENDIFSIQRIDLIDSSTYRTVFEKHVVYPFKFENDSIFEETISKSENQDSSINNFKFKFNLRSNSSLRLLKYKPTKFYDLSTRVFLNDLEQISFNLNSSNSIISNSINFNQKLLEDYKIIISNIRKNISALNTDIYDYNKELGDIVIFYLEYRKNYLKRLKKIRKRK